MRAPSPILMCPTMPTWPASTTPAPISVDPEIPTCATIKESGPGPDAGTWSDHASRSDRGGRIHLGPHSQVGGRVHSYRRPLLGMEDRAGLGEGDVGLRGHQGGRPSGHELRLVLGDDDRRGPRAGELRAVARVGVEGDFFGTGVLETRHAAHAPRTITA